MSSDEHLSQIQTLWTVVRRAHDSQPSAARAAQQALLNRYGGAAHRYLCGALGDAVAADDLYQEFALRFIRGDFNGVTPERGRFRSFVKSVLYRMVIDHFRRAKIRATSPLDAHLDPCGAEDPDVDRDRAFNEVWRDELFQRAWATIDLQDEKTGTAFGKLLRLRVDQPQFTSADLAAALSTQLGRPISISNLRVMLKRSRDTFADCLLDVVAQTLEQPSVAQLEDELVDLNLLDYCRPALQRRRR